MKYLDEKYRYVYKNGKILESEYRDALPFGKAKETYKNRIINEGSY